MAKNQVFTKQNKAVFSNLHCFVGTTKKRGLKVPKVTLLNAFTIGSPLAKSTLIRYFILTKYTA